MSAYFIETQRLYLRDFQESDFAAVHEYGSLPDFSQYELWGPNTEPHSQQFIKDSMVKATRLPRYEYEAAIILKSTNQLIGGAHIERESDRSRVGNLGYAVNPKFQNQGFATEISKALIEFGFNTLELLVIYANCDTRNIASFSVMEKCGMKRVGKMIGDRKIRGHVYDSFRYEIYARNN